MPNLDKTGQFADFLQGGVIRYTIGESTASQLPGRDFGPADAYRHVLWAAESHRRFNPRFADSFLEKHDDEEAKAEDPVGTEMDRHNNEIGKQIGTYAKENDLGHEETRDLVRKVMLESLAGWSRNSISEDWKETPQGYLLEGPDKSIRLKEDLEVEAIAVKHPDSWDSNPVDDKTGKRIDTEDANWPTRDSHHPSWEQDFLYEKDNPALSYAGGDEGAKEPKEPDRQPEQDEGGEEQLEHDLGPFGSQSDPFQTERKLSTSLSDRSDVDLSGGGSKGISTLIGPLDFDHQGIERKKSTILTGPLKNNFSGRLRAVPALDEEAPSGQPFPSPEVEKRLDELTRRAHEARARGRVKESNRLFAERERLSQRVFGDQAIVGVGLRGA